MACAFAFRHSYSFVCLFGMASGSNQSIQTDPVIGRLGTNKRPTGIRQSSFFRYVTTKGVRYTSKIGTHLGCKN